VTAAIAESVISKQIAESCWSGFPTIAKTQADELEPKLTRNGYDVRDLAEQFHAKTAELTTALRLKPLPSISFHPNAFAKRLVEKRATKAVVPNRENSTLTA
jgi:hypothetical protein